MRGAEHYASESFRSMQSFHWKQRVYRRVRRRLLSALALASASITLLLVCAQANTSASGCGYESTLEVVDTSGLEILQLALNCQDGREVVVLWDGEVVLDSPLEIGSGVILSIAGRGGSAVARGNQTQLFRVYEGGELTLTDIELTGGKATFGGAISSNGSLVLKTCVLEGNEATMSGGAIHAAAGTITISGSEFTENRAVYFGGAVYALDTELVIQDEARFEANMAEEGGAVYCGGTSSSTNRCTLDNAVFLRNNSSEEDEVDHGELVDTDDTNKDENPWAVIYGGGAAAFLYSDVGISNCTFINNTAEVSGGALYGGESTNMNITRCLFEDNYATGYGGAITGATVIIDGDTELNNNYADIHGGGIFLWDINATGTFNSFTCSNNIAEEDGGCLFVVGTVIINNGTIMRGNEANQGGGIYAFRYSNIQIIGGSFSNCHSIENGGFLYAKDGAAVTVKGGYIGNNRAGERGGALYCSGPSDELDGAAMTIEGGTIAENVAFEHGGALAVWGTPTEVFVKGGTFKKNTAQFYGGFIFIEEEASISCEGATIVGNIAEDQGGGIYARGASWVNFTCDLDENEAPQGAAAYLTHIKQTASFEDISVTDNVASSGSVFYVAGSSVVLTGVTFESSIGLQEDSFNRALQLDNGSTLVGDSCVFTGWMGDSVVHGSNAGNGSLVLNSCDFRGSSAVMAVISLYSDAEIRNALVSELTFENAEVVDGSAVLVDNALNCMGANACNSGGECADSVLGVLCECLDEDTPCLFDGGTLSLTLETYPEDETYDPDLVSFELMVSAAADGTTSAIWVLNYEAEDLELEVVPSSGVLPPGTNITIGVTGTPIGSDIGGNLSSEFKLTSVSNSSTYEYLEVLATFYLCEAFEYAVPTDEECAQCAAITDADGVNCEDPGATLASLPINSGYWRSNKSSVDVQSCLHSGACIGATEVNSSDDYCRTGYEGPLCAVCSKGYGEGAGNTCHSCEDTLSTALITVGTIFVLLILFLLILAVVFLVGGLDAVNTMRRSLANRFSSSASTVSGSRLTRKPSHREVFDGVVSGRISVAPTSNIDAEQPSETGVKTADARGIETSLPDDTSKGSPRSVASTDTAVRLRAELITVQRSDRASKMWREETRSSGGSIDRSPTASATVAVAERGISDGDSCACCGFRERIRRWWARMPLDKLKILVVVWQILTVFPSITAVDFPPIYSRFLSWIDVVNLNLLQVFSASCLLPGVNFYDKLLVTTLTPIGLCGVMVVTYHMAKRRAGIGSVGEVAKRAAWSRHMAAGLLLSFLVFTSASTAVFKTFGCDNNVIEGESYLRADYSLSCQTTTHTLYEVYAGFMILVYPIGIPLMYAFILWKNRNLLNPTLAAAARAEEERKAEMIQVSDQEGGDVEEKKSDVRGEKKRLSPEEEEELEKMIKLRRTNPDLVPSMFLWKDFGPNLYYYEVIECGRRILLTGVLIFIDPYTSTQAAAACIFAFASLLGFELLRPHLDPTDSWLYRLGCVVIFLSNFLALLIQVDAAGEGNREAMGGLLVAVNLMLVVAVILTSWYSTQQQVDDARDDENAYNTAMGVVNADRIATEQVRLAREAKTRDARETTMVRDLPPSYSVFWGGGKRASAAAVGPGSSIGSSSKAFHGGEEKGGSKSGAELRRGDDARPRSPPQRAHGSDGLG